MIGQPPALSSARLVLRKAEMLPRPSSTPAFPACAHGHRGPASGSPAARVCSVRPGPEREPSARQRADPRVALPDSSKESGGHPVTCEFRVNNRHILPTRMLHAVCAMPKSIRCLSRIRTSLGSLSFPRHPSPKEVELFLRRVAEPRACVLGASASCGSVKSSRHLQTTDPFPLGPPAPPSAFRPRDVLVKLSQCAKPPAVRV